MFTLLDPAGKQQDASTRENAAVVTVPEHGRWLAPERRCSWKPRSECTFCGIRWFGFPWLADLCATRGPTWLGLGLGAEAICCVGVLAVQMLAEWVEFLLIERFHDQCAAGGFSQRRVR